MEFDNVIKKRCSVRKFKDKRVSWKLVLESIDAALQGPFANNLNNLSFLIIENAETIKKIADIAEQDWINNSGIVVVVCSDSRPLEQLYDERGKIYSKQQAGAAILTFLLKTVDLGVSSCWVGSFNEEKLRLLLKIPKEIEIEALLPVGYEEGKTPKKRKRDLDTVIFWEEWGERKRPTFFREPDVK